MSETGKNTLYHLIQSFRTGEKRELSKFLASPFFNQRQDMIKLYELLLESTAPPEKKTLWTKLQGKTPYDDQKMRLLLSYLLQLIERFAAVREIISDPFQVSLHEVIAFRKRSMTDAFERSRKSLQTALANSPVKDLAYFETQYRLYWEDFQLSYAQNPTEASRLRDLAHWADLIYMVRKLQLLCLHTAHQQVYPSGEQLSWSPALLAMAESAEFAEHPAIRVYLHCYRMLQQPEQEAHFQTFKKTLTEESARFSAEEMHSLYIWAINYCVRRLNAGETAYAREALDMYQEALERNYLVQNEVLSRFTYHNIVAMGLQTGANDWVRYFIYQYKNRLEKKYRESSFSFNLARLAYADRAFDEVLSLLQHANYRDPLLNLAAKTLLAKTYYDLEEIDLLDAHLDAMRNYIHRKRVLGYHRTNYLNFIRFMEKITRLNPHEKGAARRLIDELAQIPVLTEKPYFVRILDGMQLLR